MLLSSFLILSCTSFAGYVLKKNDFALNNLVATCFIFVAFFLLRIWDNIMFYEEIGNNLLFRKDVLLLFLLSLEAILIPGMFLSLLIGLKGLKELRIEE